MPAESSDCFKHFGYEDFRENASQLATSKRSTTPSATYSMLHAQERAIICLSQA
jgi:hypothetical protein